MTQQPQAKYRHDYRAPEYLISDIDLTFDLDAAKTVVTAESKVSRHAAASDVPLRLDGEDLTLIALQAVSYTHLRAHETRHDLVCRLLLEKKKKIICLKKKNTKKKKNHKN